MRKLVLFVLYLISACIILCSCTMDNFFLPSDTSHTPTCSPKSDNAKPRQIGDFKAMWLSQYDLVSIYTDSKKQRSREDFTAKTTTVINNIKNLGFNTIILQVRPNADSMYPSDYYPVSEYVVGDYGNKLEYDPVEILVDLAHKMELSIHAWINPLRAMSIDDINKIDNSYKIKQWYQNENTHGKYIIEYEGKYYLNPAYEEVRNLIVDGAKEAMTKYDFDGLHMDDYFYPTTEASFDKEAYDEYRAMGGKLSLDVFRRDVLSNLVSSLYKATKEIDSKLLFGISPSGIINTVYNSQYADVYLWCSTPGYIDYICPQIYFGMEHENYDFISVCNTFRDIIKTPSVALVVGMSFGKSFAGVDNYAGSGKFEWQIYSDIMARCLDYTRNIEVCTGISVFCYQYFYDPITGEKVMETSDEVDNFLPVLGEIRWNYSEV